MTRSEAKMKGSYFQFSTFLFLGLLAYFIKILEQSYSPNSLAIVLGYFMLWTPYRDETLKHWETSVKFNTAVVYPPTPCPEIDFKDYSYEALKHATKNFRLPAVVRGMFKGTKAVEMWGTEDYLPSKLGDFTIPVVRNAVVGTLQDHRELVNFGDAFKEMYQKDYSHEYLFFPVKSRFTFNGSEEGASKALQEKVNEVCREDLEYDRFWPGFGTKRHYTFLASQFVIGKSTDQFTKKSTGSDWHCAGGNNWFVQAVGRKHWEFIEPRYSPYLFPLKGGFFNFWTGNKNIAELQKHIPRWYVDLEAGDMVYNPDWMWHRVVNYGGLSIGIPIREMNGTTTILNNPAFASIVFVNKWLSMLGLGLGGYPPPSFATEADN